MASSARWLAASAKPSCCAAVRVVGLISSAFSVSDTASSRCPLAAQGIPTLVLRQNVVGFDFDRFSEHRYGFIRSVRGPQKVAEVIVGQPAFGISAIVV